MSLLCHESDAWIKADDDLSVSLYDEEGTRLYRFAAGTPKEFIIAALGFANKAFDMGFEDGKEAKACEIKLALGIDEESV